MFEEQFGSEVRKMPGYQRARTRGPYRIKTFVSNGLAVLLPGFWSEKLTKTKGGGNTWHLKPNKKEESSKKSLWGGEKTRPPLVWGRKNQKGKGGGTEKREKSH